MVIKWFRNILVITIFSLYFGSCDVEWNSNYKETLEDSVSVVYTFYKDKNPDSPHFSRRYPIGKKLSAEDLPGDEDLDVINFKPGYKLLGWDFYKNSNNDDDLVSDYITVESGIVSEIKTTSAKYDFYCSSWEAKTDTPYSVEYWIEKADGAAEEFIEKKNMFGTTDTETVAEKLEVEVPGCSAPAVITQKEINGDGSTVVKVIYSRNIFSVTCIFDNGSVDGVGQKTFIGKFGTPIPKVKIDYGVGVKFSHWEPELPEKFPANDGFYIAKSLVAPCKIYLKDFKDEIFSGTEGVYEIDSWFGLKLKDALGTEPISKFDDGTNPVKFVGWFTDTACKIPLNENYIIDVDKITVYARWEAKIVYLDPKISKSGNGFTESSPVKTVKEAKDLLEKNSIDDKTLYVLNAITTAEDISALSNLTFESYGNAKLTRHSSYNDIILDVQVSVDQPVMNLDIDGANIDAKAPAVKVTGVGKLLLEDCNLYNNKNASGSAGAVHCGNSNNVDSKNYGVFRMKGGSIHDNYANGNGGAVLSYSTKQIDYADGYPCGSGLDGVRVYNNTAKNDAKGICITGSKYFFIKDCVIENNDSTGYDIYSSAIELFIYGKTYVDKLYINKGNSVDYLVKLVEDLNIVSGKTCVANIYIPEDKYPQGESTVKILVDSVKDSGFVNSNYDKFVLTKDGFELRNDGCIHSLERGGQLNFYDPITFKAAVSEMNYTDASKIFEIESSCVLSSDIEVTVKVGSFIGSNNHAFTVNDKKIYVDLAVLSPELYYITVTARYKNDPSGCVYDSTFALEIKNE